MSNGSERIPEFPAEELRSTAEAIRSEWGERRGGAWSAVQEFHLEVASLLSMASDHARGRGNWCPSCLDQATNIARAYLGSQS